MLDHDCLPAKSSSVSPPSVELRGAVDAMLRRISSGDHSRLRKRLSDAERWQNCRSLMNDHGVRYAAATIDSFELSEDRAMAQRQNVVLRSVQDFVDHMPERLAAGGLILFGPQGTGKDHLLVAALRSAIVEHGFSVVWRDGVRLQSEVRQAIADDRESKLRHELSETHILAISDPMPPMGELNQWQTSFLRDVVDRRYARGLTTWITCNVASLDDLKVALTPPLAARLLDRATVLHCNWPSYRRPARIVS